VLFYNGVPMDLFSQKLANIKVSFYKERNEAITKTL
jgi:hypothetical protein